MVDEIVLRFSVKDDGSPVIERVNQKINQTGKEAKGLVPGLESARGSLTGFASQNASLIGVLVGVGLAFGKALKDTMKYAGEVRDLTLATGGTAEESSRLLQVLDDYQITSADVTAGMKAMKEKGIVPTVDSLATLSKQFLAIEDPAKRLQFAQDNLGRSSAKFLNVLSQGPDTIRELNDAINEHQILTDEDIQKTEEARLAMDAWGDAVQGLEVEFTTGLIPALTNLINLDVDTAMSKAAEATGVAGIAADIMADKAREQAAQIGSATTSYMAWASSLEGHVTPALEGYVTATEAASAANEGLFGLVGSLQSATDSYKESTASLNEEWTELIQGYAAGTINAKEYEEGLAGVQEALGKTKEKHKEAMASIAYDLFVAKLKAGEFTDAEFQMAIDAGVAMGIIDQEVADMALNMSAAVESASGSTEKFSESLKQPISDITTLNGKIEATAAKAGMTWEYFFVINTKGSVPNMPNQDQSGAGTNAGVGYQSGFAGGGLVSGSGTGVKDSFLVPMANGEFVVRAGVVQQPGVLDLLKSLNSGRGMSGKGGNTFYNAVINVYANNPNEFMDALQGEL